MTDNRAPLEFHIVKEPEPLLEQGYVYRAYLKRGIPVYMGEPTRELLEARLRREYKVKCIIYEGAFNGVLEDNE